MRPKWGFPFYSVDSLELHVSKCILHCNIISRTSECLISLRRTHELYLCRDV